LDVVSFIGAEVMETFVEKSVDNLSLLPSDMVEKVPWLKPLVAIAHQFSRDI